MNLQVLRKSATFNTLFFLGLALLLGGAAGLAVPRVGKPAYIFVGLLALIGFVITIARVDIGLLLLVFLTYTRLSDIAYHYHGAPSIAKSFVVLLLIALLVRWAIFHERPQRWEKPLLLVTIYGLVGLGSMLYAAEPLLVWDSLRDYVKDALIAVVAASLLSRGPLFRRALWALLLAGILIGSFSVYQFLTKTFTNNYGGFAQAEYMQITVGSNDYRIAGVVGDPNFFAQIMVVLVPVALERMLHEQRLGLRILAGVALMLSALSVLYTYSRGGFLALAVSMLLFLIFFPPHPRRVPWLILGALVVMSFIPPSYYERILSINLAFSAPQTQFRSTDKAIQGRTSELLTGLAMFSDHPLFGVGLKNYAYLYPYYSKSIGLAPTASQRSAHNLYLETLAETGAVGFTVFMLIIVTTLRTIWAARKRFIEAGLYNYAYMTTGYFIGVVGYLMAAFFVHSAFPRYFYLLIGMGLALDAMAKATVEAYQHKREAEGGL